MGDFFPLFRKAGCWGTEQTKACMGLHRIKMTAFQGQPRAHIQCFPLPCELRAETVGPQPCPENCLMAQCSPCPCDLLLVSAHFFPFCRRSGKFRRKQSTCCLVPVWAVDGCFPSSF